MPVGDRLWSDVPLNVVVEDGGLTVDGLGYGNFLSYRAPGIFVGFKRGNGAEIYARSPRKFLLSISGDFDGVVLNDLPVEPSILHGRKQVNIAPWEKPETDLITQLQAATGGDSDAIIPVLQSHPLCRAFGKAVPTVRTLLTWNGSTVAHTK